MFEHAIVETIIAVAFGGMGIVAVAEIIKRVFQFFGWEGSSAGYVASAIASIAGTIIYGLDPAVIWVWWHYVGYSFLVFIVTNGFYKVAFQKKR